MEAHTASPAVAGEVLSMQTRGERSTGGARPEQHQQQQQPATPGAPSSVIEKLASQSARLRALERRNGSLEVELAACRAAVELAAREESAVAEFLFHVDPALSECANRLHLALAAQHRQALDDPRALAQEYVMVRDVVIKNLVADEVAAAERRKRRHGQERAGGGGVDLLLVAHPPAPRFSVSGAALVGARRSLPARAPHEGGSGGSTDEPGRSEDDDGAAFQKGKNEDSAALPPAPSQRLLLQPRLSARLFRRVSITDFAPRSASRHEKLRKLRVENGALRERVAGLERAVGTAAKERERLVMEMLRLRATGGHRLPTPPTLVREPPLQTAKRAAAAAVAMRMGKQHNAESAFACFAPVKVDSVHSVDAPMAVKGGGDCGEPVTFCVRNYCAHPEATRVPALPALTPFRRSNTSAPPAAVPAPAAAAAAPAAAAARGGVEEGNGGCTRDDTDESHLLLSLFISAFAQSIADAVGGALRALECDTPPPPLSSPAFSPCLDLSVVQLTARVMRLGGGGGMGIGDGRSAEDAASTNHTDAEAPALLPKQFAEEQALLLRSWRCISEFLAHVVSRGGCAAQREKEGTQ